MRDSLPARARKGEEFGILRSSMRQAANASDITDINLPGGNTESRSLRDGRAGAPLLGPGCCHAPETRRSATGRASESQPLVLVIDSRSPQRYPTTLSLGDPLSFKSRATSSRAVIGYGRSLNPSNRARAMILLNPHKVSSWRQDLELRMVMGEVDSGKREVPGDSQFAACTS